MPTYLYLPVVSGNPTLVEFEEAPADGHCASLSLQCRQVIRVINRLSSNLERALPKLSVSFDISRLPFIGIPHPYYVPYLVLFDFEIGRSLNNPSVLCRGRWVGFNCKDFLLGRTDLYIIFYLFQYLHSPNFFALELV
jgi:hypothetical protein